MNGETNIASLPEQLSHLFGSYKAEWLKERMFDLFTEPAYFPELVTPRPCMLLGGRGTGKTTVLRSMSYEGQFALGEKNLSGISTWSYYGLYYRVNTNRVTAFKGPELSEERWIKVFAHYFNLLMCDMVLRFLEWYYMKFPNATQLSGENCARVSNSLHREPAGSVRELAIEVLRGQAAFEAFVNNVADSMVFPLSMQGAPIDILMECVLQLPEFRNKSFFFLLDEYENFEDYQQRVINTLIKHAGDLYTFKIGVKELGWRCRTTLNENEQLVSPADYVKIRIQDKLEGERFSEFAFKVCSERISKLAVPDVTASSLKAILRAVSVDEEADILDGGDGLVSEAQKRLEQAVPGSDQLRQMSSLEKYFLVFWADSQKSAIESEWQIRLSDPKKWKERYENYKYALLFTIKRGKAGIRKFYAGWDVFVQLAAGNIRYILELVEQVLLLHLQNGGRLDEPVSPQVQTKCAIGVGKKNLSELEGLSVHGALLTKLVLGLGRIFQVMAADAGAHVPEINQFHLAEDLSFGAAPERQEEVANLLKASVMHLALLRSPGNKPTDETDTLEYDYMMHPIFSPLFVFSYRRKRKMTIQGRLLLELVADPRSAIRKILAASSREDKDPLPEQLSLFSSYYEAHS
jgi:hypothetical protein